MKRYYFVTDDLDDLAAVEDDLKAYGISPLQMHLLSDADAELQRRGMENTESLWRNNIFRSMRNGFLTGMVLAAILMAGGWLAGLESSVSWAILSVVSAIIWGFCTWEAGFKGFQQPHDQYGRFLQYVKSGKHLFFVDVNEPQREAVNAVLKTHRHLEPMGTEEGESRWAFEMRSGWNRFIKSAP